MTDTFPRQQARTSNFSLGAPRSFQISPDGNRIVFLRSKGGSDRVTCLWALDLDGSGERLIADPAEVDGVRRDEPAEERARRERSRERAGGVVAFAPDADFTMAAFALAGQVFTVDLGRDGAGPRPASAQIPAIDPRPDPTGRTVAYVCAGALRLTRLDSGDDIELIGPDDSQHDVSYGLAEFIAAEEMGRAAGYWWAPDGSALLVARVDNSPVNRWYIADPAHPERPPAQVGYPAAGTPNALVHLLVVGLDGSSVPVHWDAEAYPYLATADWDSGGPLITVQSRDQRRMRLLAVDPATGQTTSLRDDSDPSWLDIVPGVPARMADGRIVWTSIEDGARRLLVAAPADLSAGVAVPATPPALQVRGVLSVDGDTVLFSASQDDPAQVGAWTYGPGGLARLVGPDDAAGPGDTVGPGVVAGVRAGGTTVLTRRSMAEPGATTVVLRSPLVGDDQPLPQSRAVATVASLAERPVLPALRVELLRAGKRELRTALVLPSWHEPGSAGPGSHKLPILMDPYGGPHFQRVLACADSYLTSQWFADQGFAVVVADGRGTPGRGPDWDRAVAADLAGPVLDDQVDALAAVAERYADCCDLDLSKVAIRGWSFGGYLAALAVLRRPDVFHAAVAGAPVTDWRLYDTHYTERYLGDPGQDARPYERCSLIGDARQLSRPLMLIHGLADDNVVVAHTLALSSALVAAGRPHSVLPLSGVTHMASQEEVAENLLLLQVEFLRSALGSGPVAGHQAG